MQLTWLDTDKRLNTKRLQGCIKRDGASVGEVLLQMGGAAATLERWRSDAFLGPLGLMPR